MRILLIGARGQFGTAFQTVCKEMRVACFAPSHAELDVLDKRSIADALSDAKPDAVINSTGIVDIAACETDPQTAFNVNTHGALLLAETCAEAGITLVQTSTHLVFDGTKSAPYDETDLPAPNTVYAATKLAGEHLALTRNPRSYAVRFPTLYGARRNDKMGFVEKMLEKLQAGDDLRIADDRMDSPTWTMDAAREVLALITEQAPYGLHHVSNNGPVSYFDFISALARIIGAESGIKAAKDSEFPAHPPKPLRLAITSAKRPALRSWEEALFDYAESLGLTK